MTTPLRMVGPPHDVTGGNTGVDGTPQQPPPPAGPREGPQPAPQEEEGPPGGAQQPAVQGEPPAEGNPPATQEGPPAQPLGPQDGPPATSAMYVETWNEYLAEAAEIDALLEMAGPGSRAMLAQGISAVRAKGHQLDERVRAPIFDTEKGGVKVNGKPITGVAILDTGCMPFIIGEPGKKQLGLTDEDIIPNAVRLGLADGNATQLQGLTKRTIKLTSIKGPSGRRRSR
jgi:hypothetical protein